MSFLNIKDPDARDAMIEDYLELKKRLKERNMEEHSNLILHERDLEDHFKPVVASNQKMAEEIVKDLIPIKDELQEMNRNIEIRKQPRLKIGNKRRMDSAAYGPLAESFIQKYMNSDQKQHIDTTFGIRYENGIPMIGNKIIRIEGDNIVIGDEVYIGTPGLWTLITDRIPTAVEYNTDDYERYKELLYETSVLHHHYDPSSNYPRSNRSLKWHRLLGPIWQEFQQDGIAASSDDETADSVKGGDGIIYHPINGCRCYLQKNGRCFAIRAANGGGGIHFSPRPLLAGIRGDGLYLRMGSSVYNGNGLLMGPHSPFRRIPILKWIL